VPEENLQRLIDLQEKDRRLVLLQREARAIPDKKEALKDKIRGAQAAVDTTKSSHMHLLSDIKQLELEVETCKAQVRRYRSQQNEIRNTEAYQALEDEIREMGRKIRTMEDRELELMEQSEAMQKEIVSRQAQLVESTRDIDADLVDMDERLARVNDSIASLEADRAAMAAQIDQDWLRRYELILKNKGDVALVKVDANGVCTGCHMRVPPNVVVESKNPKTMTFCSNCGRMLFHFYLASD